MKTECPHCGQHYDIDDEDQNCQFQCVNCQTIFCPCSFVETINSSIDLSQFFVHYRTGGDCHKIDDSFDVADDLPQGYEFYRENKWTGKNILVTGFKYELYIAIRSLVRKIKATPVTRVTKTGCDVVVYGSEERFTTSFETAAKYGIPMITIQEFIDDIIVKIPDHLKKDNIGYWVGKNICFTGFSVDDKESIQKICEEFGINIKNNISAKCDALVCGPNAGPAKIAKCKEMNIPIISAQEFFANHL